MRRHSRLVGLLLSLCRVALHLAGDPVLAAAERVHVDCFFGWLCIARVWFMWWIQSASR